MRTEYFFVISRIIKRQDCLESQIRFHSKHGPFETEFDAVYQSWNEILFDYDVPYEGDPKLYIIAYKGGLSRKDGDYLVAFLKRSKPD